MTSKGKANWLLKLLGAEVELRYIVTKEDIYMGARDIPRVITYGKHNGRVWAIREGVSGFPCGYVLLTHDEEKKYKGRYEWDVDVDVKMHGGCTYIGDLGIEQGTWIGFDTVHFYDNESTQNIEFVKDECFNVIDQLLARRAKKTR